MTPHELNNYWTTTYPECLPIPYLLRSVFHDRWVRFHSLPESKRYPEDEREFQTVLQRHDVVLGELAEPDEALVFVSTGYSDTPQSIRDNDALNERDPKAQCWRTIEKHIVDGDEEYPNYWHLFMSIHNWQTGCFRSILRLVADNTIANTMILSTRNQWLYHPYDGGADVTLKCSTTRDRLRSQFRSWLSRRTDGL